MVGGGLLRIEIQILKFGRKRFYPCAIRPKSPVRGASRLYHYLSFVHVYIQMVNSSTCTAHELILRAKNFYVLTLDRHHGAYGVFVSLGRLSLELVAKR